MWVHHFLSWIAGHSTQKMDHKSDVSCCNEILRFNNPEQCLYVGIYSKYSVKVQIGKYSPKKRTYRAILSTVRYNSLFISFFISISLGIRDAMSVYLML